MSDSDGFLKERIIVCHSCDIPVVLPAYRKGYQCRCPRCHALLRPAFIFPFTNGAVIAFSALLLLLGAISQPLFSISASGLSVTVSLLNLFDGLEGIWKILTCVFAFSVFVFPLIFLCILSILGFMRIRPSKLIAEAYTISHFFCFVDVFALAIGISLIKITALASVEFYSGFYLYLIFTFLLMWCWKSFPPRSVWSRVKIEEHIDIDKETTCARQGIKLCKHCGFVFKSQNNTSEKCPRCGKKTFYRKYMWEQRCIAMLLAAAVMFLPSNIFPIMFTTYLGNTFGSNIMDGAWELFSSGSWFVACVIVIASLFIPGFKILALSYLIIKVKKGKITNPAVLSKLYRIVEFIGKWSMLDVFVVILMASAVRFYNLMAVAPGLAVIAFCAVVLLTLEAATYFDERLIWDRSVE